MLHSALERLDEESENEALIDWVRNVCDPEFGIVDGLVANFIDFVDDSEYAKKILKILKKLNQHVSDLTMVQLSANMQFPVALVKYLESTDMKDLAGDAFVLLVNIFDDQSATVASENFV